MDIVTLYEGTAGYYNSLCYFDHHEVIYLLFGGPEQGEVRELSTSSEGLEKSDTALAKVRI